MVRGAEPDTPDAVAVMVWVARWVAGATTAGALTTDV